MGIDLTATTECLVSIFRDNCLMQDETYISGNTKKRNKLIFANRDICTELAGRSGDERRALLSLLTHANPQVRLQAAKEAYPVSPAQCRTCLETIRAAKFPDQSLDAGMTLYFLDQDPHSLD